MSDTNLETTQENKTQEAIAEFAKKLSYAIENDNLPFSKNSMEEPFNPKTGYPYGGSNNVMLKMVSGEKGYDDPRWLTFNEGKELGGTVMKGEKATKLLILDRDGSSRLTFKYFNVFNANQFKGLNLPPIEKNDMPFADRQSQFASAKADHEASNPREFAKNEYSKLSHESRVALIKEIGDQMTMSRIGDSSIGKISEANKEFAKEWLDLLKTPEGQREAVFISNDAFKEFKYQMQFDPVKDVKHEPIKDKVKEERVPNREDAAIAGIKSETLARASDLVQKQERTLGSNAKEKQERATAPKNTAPDKSTRTRATPKEMTR